MNQQISKIFREMSLFYEMQDDTFRARAYENGAMTIETMGEDLRELYKEGGVKALEDLPNIGRGMAEKIEEFIKTGKVKEYQTLKKKMPVDIEELTSVEGLGPKGVKTIYTTLGIKNLKELEKAAKAGKIRELEGFGEKSEQNILEGIEFLKQSSGRMLLGAVLPRVNALVEELKEMKEVIDISPAGSLRRRRETIGDIDILVATEEPEKVIARFVGLRDVIKVWSKGPTKASVRVERGFDMDLRVVPKESWGAALQYFTGSKAHNIKLRQIAIDKHFKLNEYGLFRGNGSTDSTSSLQASSPQERIAGATEKEVYEALGLVYLEPELREDTGEIELLQQGKPLPKVIPYGSLKGDLQVQTNWTDGDHSILEMAKEAKRLGREYIAITDHTRDLAMVSGSDEEKLLRQMREIDRLNKEMKGLTILKGAEVNIRKDGSLDISDEVLAKLDVVGASVHSALKMSRRDMTARIIRAMQNTHVNILFHPTGRRIQKREAYDVDIEEVIKEAVKTNTVLEINAFPERLDLRDEHIRLAVQLGARFVIDSDAHNTAHLFFLEFGIAQARRGWATAKDVLNTLPLEQFLTKLK